MWKSSSIITVAIVLLSGGAALARERTIKCESQSERSKYCATGTTGRVELRRQLSRTDCTEYDTWGTDDDGGGVWVRNGCRAIFTVRERRWGRHGRDRDDDRDDDHARGDAPSIVRCASDNWAYNHCSVPGRHWRSTMVKQHSGTRCVRDSNWGEDRDGIWVNKGCDAEFEVQQR